MISPEELIAKAAEVKDSSEHIEELEAIMPRLIADERNEFGYQVISYVGKHEDAQGFLGGVSLASQVLARPLRGVFNGYEFEIDGKVKAEDLGLAYHAVRKANLRLMKAPGGAERSNLPEAEAA